MAHGCVCRMRLHQAPTQFCNSPCILPCIAGRQLSLRDLSVSRLASDGATGLAACLWGSRITTRKMTLIRPGFSHRDCVFFAEHVRVKIGPLVSKLPRLRSFPFSSLHLLLPTVEDSHHALSLTNPITMRSPQFTHRLGSRSRLLTQRGYSPSCPEFGRQLTTVFHCMIVASLCQSCSSTANGCGIFAAH
jgi:hypothetical protein